MSAADESHNRATTAHVATVLREHFMAVVLEAHRSIQSGSELTGAPGQPVDTGNLRNSWQVEFPSPDRGRIGTNVEYAEAVEDAVGPHGPRVYGAKNNIGGSHSVKLTVANIDRIVDAVKRRAPLGAP